MSEIRDAAHVTKAGALSDQLQEHPERCLSDAMVDNHYDVIRLRAPLRKWKLQIWSHSFTDILNIIS